MTHMSAEEYRNMNSKKKKISKYRSQYIYVYEDGLASEQKDLTGHGAIVRKYDSKKEYARHKELELLERGGAISDLKWQVRLLLQEGFTDRDGNKIRPIYYKADFTYTQNGREVVEDVKGIDRYTGKIRTTEAFQLKWKLLRARYPTKSFRIF